MAKAPCTIILAAGKGTRMHSESTPKVCFPVNGVPAIVRAMRSYAAAGVKQFVVVVGTLAEAVMKTVGAEFPNCVYAFQPEQNGTAGAVASAMAGERSPPMGSTSTSAGAAGRSGLKSCCSWKT